MKKILLLLLSFFLVGCYDYKELDDIHIVSSILVDYDSEYVISFEIVKNDQENNIKTDFITGRGETISDAIHSIKENSSKELFLEHVEVMCISKSLAKYGIEDLIDYIIRDLSINNNYYVVVTDSVPYYMNRKEEDSIGDTIVQLVNQVMSENDVFTIDMVERDLINHRKDIVLPYIEDLTCKEIAYFEGGKFIDTISNDIYRMVLLDSDQGVFHYDDNIIHIYRSKIHYQVERSKVIVSITLYGRILEIDEDISLSKEDTYELLNEKFSKSIGDEIQQYFHSISSDILGIRGLYEEKYGVQRKVDYSIQTKVNINKNGGLFEVDYDS